MDFFSNSLPAIQIVLSILLVTAVLLQQSEAGMGGALGGDGGSGSYHTRRGFEKTLFNGTIVLGIIFALTSFLALIL
jgi:preprotein translocase subunit SecG